MKAIFWFFVCAVTAGLWLRFGWLPAVFFALAVLVFDELRQKAREVR